MFNSLRSAYCPPQGPRHFALPPAAPKGSISPRPPQRPVFPLGYFFTAASLMGVRRHPLVGWASISPRTSDSGTSGAAGRLRVLLGEVSG